MEARVFIANLPLQVMYLRQFSQLQSLALAGNPLAGEEHYQSYVIAFVPSLVYLDFRMVLEEEVRKRCIKQCT